MLLVSPSFQIKQSNIYAYVQECVFVVLYLVSEAKKQSECPSICLEEQRWRRAKSKKAELV